MARSYEQEEYHGEYQGGPQFADPGGRSALRAASRRSPRNRPCPRRRKLPERQKGEWHIPRDIWATPGYGRESRWTCGLCDQTFCLLQEARKHMIEVHEQKEE